MKPGPGEGCSQGGRPPSFPPCRCWQRRHPAGESGLPPLPPRAHSPGEGAAGGLCVLPRIPTLSYTPNKARFFVHRSTGLRLGGSLMRMGRESPARGEDSGTGRPGRAGAQRAPPQSLKPRSGQGRGVARPSRARPAARSSSAAAAAMVKPPGALGTGREARRRCRAAPSAAERRGARVTSRQRSGGQGEPAIGRGAGARRSQRALIGPWREGAGRARSARAVLSARGRAGLWRPWRRRRRSSTCPSLPPICCGMAAPGGTWCGRCWLPATCRPHSQVNCPHAPFPVGPGPAAGSRASPRLCFAAAFRAASRARGALAVLEHFDCVYSVLQ